LTSNIVALKRQRFSSAYPAVETHIVFSSLFSMPGNHVPKNGNALRNEKFSCMYGLAYTSPSQELWSKSTSYTRPLSVGRGQQTIHNNVLSVSAVLKSKPLAVYEGMRDVIPGQFPLFS
jgi:hypothetical protein